MSEQHMSRDPATVYIIRGKIHKYRHKCGQHLSMARLDINELPHRAGAGLLG